MARVDGKGQVRIVGTQSPVRGKQVPGLPEEPRGSHGTDNQEVLTTPAGLQVVPRSIGGATEALRGTKQGGGAQAAP